MRKSWLIALCLSVSAPALAQDSGPSAEDKKEAKRLIAEAQQAYKIGDFDACAEKFSAAYKLASLPQIQFNLGLCYERLSRYRDAAVEYEAAADHKDMPGPMRETANENLAKMREHMSKVRIEGDSLDVRIDDTIKCKIPCAVYLEPGTHEVIYGPDNKRKAFTNSLNRELVVNVKLEKTDSSETNFDATEEDGSARPDLTSTGVSATSSDSSSGPGLLTWGGGALGVAGTASAVFFGLKTRGLHDDFMMTPTQAIADDGDQARNLTNVSIGVALFGVSLVVYDLLTD